MHRRLPFLLLPLAATAILLAIAPPRSGRFHTPADVQQTTAPDGGSPLEGESIAVEGVVVAVSAHFDFFYIAHPAGGAWSGLKVPPSPCAI